jgi:hypothetical protein
MAQTSMPRKHENQALLSEIEIFFSKIFDKAQQPAAEQPTAIKQPVPGRRLSSTVAFWHSIYLEGKAKFDELKNQFESKPKILTFLKHLLKLGNDTQNGVVRSLILDVFQSSSAAKSKPSCSNVSAIKEVQIPEVVTVSPFVSSVPSVQPDPSKRKREKKHQKKRKWQDHMSDSENDIIHVGSN